MAGRRGSLPSAPRRRASPARFFQGSCVRDGVGRPARTKPSPRCSATPTPGRPPFCSTARAPTKRSGRSATARSPKSAKTTRRCWRSRPGTSRWTPPLCNRVARSARPADARARTAARGARHGRARGRRSVRSRRRRGVVADRARVGTAIDGLRLGRGEAQARIADTQEKILDELRLLPSKLRRSSPGRSAPTLVKTPILRRNSVR